MAEKRAVVLLSGGMDSAVAAAMVKAEGYELFGLTFDYGQRNLLEVESSVAVAKSLGFVGHKIFQIEPGDLFGKSSLTDFSVDLPKDFEWEKSGDTLPSTYVPYRNLIFMSFAASWAETLGAFTLVAGFEREDYGGYPDCSKAFLSAMELTLTAASKKGSSPWRVISPIIDLSEVELVHKGLELGVDYSLTTTCYQAERIDGKIVSCGVCNSCVWRKGSFEKAGVVDPVNYKN